MSKSYLNRNDLPRGLRNNNPGNLIYTSETWHGKVPYSENTDWEGTPTNIKRKFEQYYELRYGIRALMRDLIHDITEGKTTVSQLITEYAPAIDNNDTGAYIASVINSIDSSTVELTQETIIALCKAIVFCGKRYAGTDLYYQPGLPGCHCNTGQNIKKKSPSPNSTLATVAIVGLTVFAGIKLFSSKNKAA